MLLSLKKETRVPENWKWGFRYHLSERCFLDINFQPIENYDWSKFIAKIRSFNEGILNSNFPYLSLKLPHYTTECLFWHKLNRTSRDNPVEYQPPFSFENSILIILPLVFIKMKLLSRIMFPICGEVFSPLCR